MPVAPEAVVQAPQPGPLNGSLLQTFAPEANPDDRWEAGVLWRPEPKGSIDLWDPCDAGTNENVTADAAVEDRAQNSLLFVATEAGSTWAWDEMDVAGRAVRSSNYGLSRAVERELWTGTQAASEGFTSNLFLMGGSPNWTAMTSPAVASSRYGYMTGLALLQRENARIGSGQGVIHASPYLVSLWQSGGALLADGRQIRDIFGNLVVAGGGYGHTAAPSGDSGDAVNYEWATVTGPVQVRVSDELLLGSGPSEIVDRRTNTATQYVGRVVNVLFDYTVHVGLRIDMDTANQVPT